MNPIISVVMPAFNAQRHLLEAIHAILQQSFPDFELIIINDGSIDQTADILVQAAKTDTRIKVFYQENAGVSVARNFGLTQVQGTYFTFVDADDLVHPDWLQLMYQAASKHHAQLVNCEKQLFAATKLFCTQFADLGAIEVLSTQQGIKRLFTTEIESAPWGKLYLSAHFLENRFAPNIGYMEDALYVFNALKATVILVDLSIPLYGYRQHTESVTHTVRVKYIEDSLFVGKAIYQGCLQETWFENLSLNMKSFLLQQCALVSISKLLYATENHWVLCIKIRDFVQKELKISLGTLKMLPNCRVEKSRAQILFAPAWQAKIIFSTKHWYTQQRIKHQKKRPE